MKVKAVIRGNDIAFRQLLVFKKPELDVEVEISDEDAQILSDEDFKKMTLSEMAEVIWSKAKITGENLKNINKPYYKELLTAALMEKYKE